MKRPVYIYIAFILGVSLTTMTACEKSAGGEESTEKATAESSEDKGATEKPDESSDEKALFDAEKKWKPCDIVTAKLVADTFGVPAGEIETPAAGSMLCVHNWESKDGSKELKVNVNRVYVKKDVETAKKWYGNMTKNRSKEEMKKQMDDVKKRARKKLDEEGKSETHKKASDSIVDSLGTSGQSYEKVDGVGDEAAINTQDANIYARVGNIILSMSAYHGEPHESPKTTDIEAIKKASAEFQKKTYDKRKKDTIKLAKAAVKKLESMR